MCKSGKECYFGKRLKLKSVLNSIRGLQTQISIKHSYVFVYVCRLLCCSFVLLQYVDKVLKHKQIENQLLEAKLAQQTLIMNEEREQALKEKQQLLQESLEYQKKCEQLVKDEAELKLQVSITVVYTVVRCPLALKILERPGLCINY